MGEEPDYPQSLVPTIIDGGMGRPVHTYGFVAAKLDEGVEKRANTCEAEGHPDVLRISRGESLDVTLEGLDDGKHHFLKVWIQEVRLLLVTFYLRKSGADCHQNQT